MRRGSGGLWRHRTGTPASPTFREALETTVVCDAIIKSGQTGKWLTLK